MKNRQAVRGWRWVRRLLALLLGVLGCWVFGLTGALDGIAQNLLTLGAQPWVTVGAFPLALEGDLYGLLLSSALLSTAQEEVFALLSLTDGLGQTISTSTPISHGENNLIYAQGEDDDTDTPNLPAAQAEDVVNYTATGDDSENYLWISSFYIANRSLQHLTTEYLEGLLDAPNYALEEGAKILIIHTHGTEAYTPLGEDSYVESDPYRTTNNQQNIVRVGEEMASLLRQAGYQVLHDTNLYDYPDYNSSYANSRTAAEAWLAQYPDIALILDVHRDALTTLDGDPYRLVGEDGSTAQFMMVVGTDDTLTHDNWETTFTLALQLQDQLTADWGELCRPTTLRSSRYNQDLSPYFLLVEIGGHGNTLQDAILGAQCFTQSLITSLSGSEEGSA